MDAAEDAGGDYVEMPPASDSPPTRQGHPPPHKGDAHATVTHSLPGAGRGRKDIERQKHEPKRKSRSPARAPEVVTASKKTELSEVRRRQARSAAAPSTR